MRTERIGFAPVSYTHLHFEGLIANRFIPEQLLETFDTKDRFYALCEQYGLSLIHI